MLLDYFIWHFKSICLSFNKLEALLLISFRIITTFITSFEQVVNISIVFK